jgi:hypothetical protein
MALAFELKSLGPKIGTIARVTSNTAAMLAIFFHDGLRNGAMF